MYLFLKHICSAFKIHILYISLWNSIW